MVTCSNLGFRWRWCGIANLWRAALAFTFGLVLDVGACILYALPNLLLAIVKATRGLENLYKISSGGRLLALLLPT